MKCEECDGKVVKRNVPYAHLGVMLGNFPAEVCGKCGETVFAIGAAKEIERKAKQLGVWGLTARTKVGMSGNSLDVRIDKRIAEFLKLKKGTVVTLQPEGRDKLVLYV